MTLGEMAPAPAQVSKTLAVASLVIGVLSMFTCGGLVIGALVGAGLGVAALQEAKRSPRTHGGKDLAILGIAASVASLVLLVIAIPSLLPSRVTANETANIVDIRAMISAQTSYQELNGGQYDSLECLAAPARCIPKYASRQRSFLDGSLVEPVRRHYRRTLHPGPPSDPQGRGTRYSPSSFTAFAYVAEPMEPGRTGVRAFCGDDTGMVCSASSGRISPGKDGRCPRDCRPLD